MNIISRGFFWGGIYVALILVPLFFLLLAPAPAGSGFWWDLSAAFGFVGAAIMATMFVLTARFKRATAPFGIDLIYYFHRQIGLVAVFFIVFHPLLLLAADRRLIFFVRPSASPYHLEAGIASFIFFILIIITSVWRKKLQIHYDSWRFWHALLALLAMVLAVIHIEGVGHYVDTFGSSLLWGAIVSSCLLIMLYVRIGKPLWLLAHPYRVSSLVNEAGNAWTLVLRPDKHNGFSFQPGQFAWLTLWSTPFAMKEHPFSLSSSAESADISFTIKELGDFTRNISSVEPGQLAFVDAPYGVFTIDRFPAAGYGFVVGGIGIAPIMSMLRTLADRNDQRPLLLIYAYNTWAEMTFREELDSLQDRLEIEIIYVLKRPPENWTGEVGLVRDDLFRIYVTEERKEYEYFVCGPNAMLTVAERGLHQAGVPLRRIHSELFDLV